LAVITLFEGVRVVFRAVIGCDDSVGIGRCTGVGTALVGATVVGISVDGAIDGLKLSTVGCSLGGTTTGTV